MTCTNQALWNLAGVINHCRTVGRQRDQLLGELRGPKWLVYCPFREMINRFLSIKKNKKDAFLPCDLFRIKYGEEEFEITSFFVSKK